MQEDSQDLYFLDGLRGLAAFYVVVGHARWLLWEGYSTGFLKHSGDYTLLEKLIVYSSSAFTLGHQAVLFFFVLSGFVIHLRYAKQLSTNRQGARFDWQRYIYRRSKRLYPTLIFAMAVTLFLDWLGQSMGYPIYFQNTPYPQININLIPDHSALTALGNLAFVMTSYVPAWGTNGPLWSLKFEWWFYMIYPIFWRLSKKSITLATTIMLVLFLLSFYPGVWAIALFRDIFSMMLAWWFGVLLADTFTKRISFSFRWVALLSVLLLILPLLNFNNAIQDILWGLAFSGFIAACFVLQTRGWNLRLLKRLKPLGDMSFTLYVIHFPILVFLSGKLMSSSRTQELPSHFGWVFLGICICVTAAYYAHLIAEKPFIARKNLKTTFSDELHYTLSHAGKELG